MALYTLPRVGVPGAPCSESRQARSPSLPTPARPGPRVQISYVIGQLSANFKTRRIMHTGYRWPLATFPETIPAVVALHFNAAS